VSAIAAVAVSRKQVRLVFPATCGEGIAERAPVSPTLERVLRYPDQVWAARSLRAVRR
jgi:hypothetical protein